MSHDIQDLLDLIKNLEERIIALEMTRVVASELAVHIHGEDAYYWEHG